MKRIVGLAIAGALALAIADASADARVGVVNRVHGPVSIEREGVKIPASAGAELQKGDRIVTDKDAYAELRVRGASPVRVGSNANIAVDRLAADEKALSGKSIPVLLQGLASLVTGASKY